jgi:hypothetical protein
MPECPEEELGIEWWKRVLFIQLRHVHQFASCDNKQIAHDCHVKAGVFLELIGEVFSRHGLKQSEHEEWIRIRKETYPSVYGKS